MFASALREDRPDVFLTFVPEGVTGPEDHITVGRAATDAFHRVRTEEGGGFARLLYQCIPQANLDRLNRLLVSRGSEPIDPSQPFQPRGVDDELIAVDVDTAPVWQVKLAPPLGHRTQSAELQRLPEGPPQGGVSAEN